MVTDSGYIGKAHLQTAITTVLNNPLPSAPLPVAFAVLRVPFFLEPDYDENATYVESNRERLIKKWGGEQGWERQKARHDLKGRGIEAGIPYFNLDRLAANSMSSHRLIQYLGKTYGLAVSEAVYDCLNVYYFVDGHSLNDRPRLAQVVAERLATLVEDPPTEQQLLEFLNSNSGRKEIETAVRMVHELGIHGIPKFLIEGKTVVDGAAHADVFIDIFRDIEARGKIARGPIFGDILGVPPSIIQQASHHAPLTKAV
jgi:predicted DsbA family dithiol-disulfide isomerase